MGVTQDEVQIEIIREPSRGVLGIGARDAVVQLTIVPAVKAQVSVPAAKVQVEEKAPPEPAKTEPVEKPPKKPAQALSDEEILALSKDLLAELLEKMQIDAKIEAKIENPKFPGDEPALVLDLQGKDLGFLIGRKGATLAAIQHVTRLMVNKATQQRANLIVDIEGYKSRREHALKKLALRIADKATKRNRRIALEPMNAYERRIIHLTLRNHPTVTTESVGDKDRRKVTILPRS